MESSSQVTPGLSQLVTRGQGTSEQLQVISDIQSRSDLNTHFRKLHLFLRQNR